ncbi:hypothetical protein [Thermocoleostomius sinensis]|uniref:Uncharacterized protein n=1 Tax=Thermocoleostomius sinensis A174 TaxID=2016057 RepID=A0A9E8Z8R1_9CYAN|nr:hypothetical protein [Thermocoleostomius sinensis]WAL58386.1 hypothetical protein OXH18_14465 [Thermocoleostomius sinensis A174]
MTATITPKSGVPNLKRIDPSTRMQDYKKALEFYLSIVNKGCDGIVFAENSNSDITELKSLVEEQGLTEQVEFIVFDGLDYPPHYDRGYGEFKLLDYAMENSKFIHNQTNRTVIWKVTGRYIISNLQHIFYSQPNQFDVYCNCRNYPKRWVDTYFMAWTPAAYETCFRDVYHRLKTNVPGIPQGIAAEELLRSWLDQKFLRQTIKFVYRFYMTPEVEGIRGADNKGYSTDEIWKLRIRKTLQRTMPWLWV